jgi:hypothetical protein
MGSEMKISDGLSYLSSAKAVEGVQVASPSIALLWTNMAGN